jgi:hypothetical protein
MPTPNYQTICQKLLATLPQKQKEVIERRFGLANGERETLQKIGDDFGVSRERIRQIEKEAFWRLEKEKEKGDLKKVFFHFEKYLKDQGGLKREDILLSNLGKSDFQNHVYFLLTLGDPFHRFSETQDLYPFWAQDQGLFYKAKEIVNALFEIFEREKRPLPEDHLLKTEIAKKQDPKIFWACIEIAKKIEKGPLGQIGLVYWPEIKPRGVKDKAYLTLKKIGKPLHFREIAQFSTQFQGECFQNRPILLGTLHNELIRDERFVLVGRGIYALKEWGYIPGTVKDIITEILKKAQRPMSKEEILKEVQKQRLVKQNTVLLNLADKNYFLKTDEGKYILNERALNIKEA